MTDLAKAAGEQWMGIAQAARLLECSDDTVRRLIDQGKLVAMKTVLGRLVDPASVASLKAERTK